MQLLTCSNLGQNGACEHSEWPLDQYYISRTFFVCVLISYDRFAVTIISRAVVPVVIRSKSSCSGRARNCPTDDHQLAAPLRKNWCTFYWKCWPSNDVVYGDIKLTVEWAFTVFAVPFCPEISLSPWKRRNADIKQEPILGRAQVTQAKYRAVQRF